MSKEIKVTLEGIKTLQEETLEMLKMIVDSDGIIPFGGSSKLYADPEYLRVFKEPIWTVLKMAEGYCGSPVSVPPLEDIAAIGFCHCQADSIDDEIWVRRKAQSKTDILLHSRYWITDLITYLKRQL